MYIQHTIKMHFHFNFWENSACLYLMQLNNFCDFRFDLTFDVSNHVYIISLKCNLCILFVFVCVYRKCWTTFSAVWRQ